MFWKSRVTKFPFTVVFKPLTSFFPSTILVTSNFSRGFKSFALFQYASFVSLILSLFSTFNCLNLWVFFSSIFFLFLSIFFITLFEKLQVCHIDPAKIFKLEKHQSASTFFFVWLLLRGFENANGGCGRCCWRGRECSARKWRLQIQLFYHGLP